MTMRDSLCFVAILLAGAAPLTGAYGNADAIGEDELKAYLYFLASDQMEGRNYPSRGYDTAALYVASHLAEWGLKPGGSGNGTKGPLQPYFMPVELVSRQLAVEESKAFLTVSGRAPAPVPSQVTSFSYGKDWFFGSPGFAGGPREGYEVSGNLVFAGNGWVINKTGADPYKGIEVRGKIIIVAGRPAEMTTGLTGAACRDFFSPQQYAARNGALAVVTIVDSANAAYMLKPANPRASVDVKKFQHADACPSAPVVTAGLELTNALFAGERQNGAQVFYAADRNTPLESFALNERKTLKLHLAIHSEDAHGENVIGILEGADPGLRNEYVILSAHLDHLGLSAPRPDGPAVFNGADDDASGSAALLAIAHAYAAGGAKGIRPRRSILFLWNGGEEKGLSGSRYFAEFPPIDLSKAVAMLQMDMIGRTKNPGSVDGNKTHALVEHGEVMVMGPNISSAELENTIEAVNVGYQHLKLNHFYDVTRPDATHDNLGPPMFGQGLFYRSDQYSFAKMGIPVLCFTTGLHEDYHGTGDTPEKIDYKEVQMVAKTAAAIGWELAARNGRPRLNATLPEELSKAMEAARNEGWGKVTPVLAPLPGMPF